jgi:hypothetical protein
MDFYKPSIEIVMNQLPIVYKTNHDELLSLINPLVDFMDQHGYTFLLVAGKDGTCSRYMRGNYDDLHGIIKGMTETQPQLLEILKEIAQ